MLLEVAYLEVAFLPYNVNEGSKSFTYHPPLEGCIWASQTSHGCTPNASNFYPDIWTLPPHQQLLLFPLQAESNTTPDDLGARGYSSTLYQGFTCTEWRYRMPWGWEGATTSCLSRQLQAPLVGSEKAGLSAFFFGLVLAHWMCFKCLWLALFCLATDHLRAFPALWMGHLISKHSII